MLAQFGELSEWDSVARGVPTAQRSASKMPWILHVSKH